MLYSCIISFLKKSNTGRANYLIVCAVIMQLCLFLTFFQALAQNAEQDVSVAGDTAGSPQGDPDNAGGYSGPETFMDIKKLGADNDLYSFELRQVDIADLFRVLAHDYRLNFIIDKEVQGKITASFTNVSLSEALEAIAESQNLALEKKAIS